MDRIISLSCNRRNGHRSPSQSYQRKCAAPALMSWLVDKGSLTQRLIRVCPGRFQVQILQQKWGRAHFDEGQALGMDQYIRVWQREVLLICDEHPWVYARTVIPITTLVGPARRLLRLNNRPLGAALFADPTVVRGNLEIFCLNPHQRLYKQAAQFSLETPNHLWGRRSLFWINKRPLLVAEVFLLETECWKNL